MTIFNPFPNTPQIAPETRAANQVIMSASQLAQMMVNSYTTAYNQVWKNPAATPDKIVAALGTNAVKLFTAADALATYLAAEGVTGLLVGIPAGWVYTPNTDGSAVVAATA